MKRYALKCGKVFDGNTISDRKTVIINGTTVEDVFDGYKWVPDAYFYDFSNMLLAPGFIDLQVNGGGGVLLNKHPDVDTLKTIRDAHEQFGVLNILPTLISADMDTIKAAVAAVGEFGTEDGILGLHLEGPFISKARKGIHSERFVRSCTMEELTDIYQNAGDCIKMLTFAPEAMSRECLQYITSHNTLPMIGHSDAGCREAADRFANGAVGVTHLFNAMSGLRNRAPGIIGASFLAQGTWAGIIADGIHVDYENIMIAKRLKGNRLFLVSDAMPPVGAGECDFTIDGKAIRCEGGKCVSDDGTIAGSALNMNQALKNIVTFCDIAVDEALRMTSTYPAQLLRVDDRLGVIRKGSFADLILLDNELTVRGIIRHGAWRKRDV